MNRRKNSLRIEGFDYSLGYWYYVTILTDRRRRIFGSITNGKNDLSAWGTIAFSLWKKIPNHFSHAELDYFVIMPNHIHGIIILDEDRKGSACRTPTEEKFQKPNPYSLSTIIRSYKSAVTREINIESGRKNKVWHRSFYDHIIRNETDLFNIRQYIQLNPAKWELDDYYGE